MFNSETYDVILARILGRIDSTKHDIKEGSLLRTVIEPIARRLAEAYSDMDAMIDQTFPATCEYEELVDRAYDRGILPIQGTPAVIRISITPATLELTEGEEFSVGDLVYSVIAQVDDGVYQCRCNEDGTAGNIKSGTVVPVNDIEGLTAVSFVSLDIAGTDDEPWESLFDRCVATYATQACGGNRKWYKETIEGLGDVYACRVFPATDGKSVVAFVWGATTNGAPMWPKKNATLAEFDEVVSGVQEALDHNKDGAGKGVIPSGHILIARSPWANRVVWNNTVTVTLEDGYTLSDVEDSVKQKVRDFYEITLMDRWKNTLERSNPNSYKGELITQLASIPGIADVTVAFSSSATIRDMTLSTYYTYSGDTVTEQITVQTA